MSGYVRPDKHVYFIRPVGRDGPIKIGSTRWPGARLEFLSLWSWCPLEIMASGPGGHILERTIHNMFADQRLHKEWFSDSPRLLEAIDRVAQGWDVAEAFGLERRQVKDTVRFAPAQPQRRAA